jgi:hypothetical protein
MSSIVSTGLLSCGLAIAGLSPAFAAAESCATGTGPVPEGTQVVGPCMNRPTPVCPARGPVYECKDGKWFCLYNLNHQPLQPCTGDKAGAWVWTNDKGLHRP